MRGLAERKQAALLYGTNYSIGVQVMLQLAAKMGESLKDSGYVFSVEETHHTSKLDSPSGTALTLAKTVEKATGLPNIPITAHREGDAAGTHILVAKSEADRMELRHESFSRRGFAEGAVRAAEWLSTRTGCYDFQDVWTQM
jgi:4-hydroxy-tetrahydrodipicolinate reductase